MIIASLDYGDSSVGFDADTLQELVQTTNHYVAYYHCVCGYSFPFKLTIAMKEVIDWAFENCNVPVKEVKPGLDASELAIHLENGKVVPINVDQFNRAVKLSAHSYTVSAHSEFKPILVKHFDKDGKLVAFAIVSPLSPFRPAAYPPNRKGKRKPKANPDKITVK